MGGEKLAIVLRMEEGRSESEELRRELERRNSQLLNYKRISGWLIWDEDFPRTASMKIKRVVLAEQIRQRLERTEALKEL